jgi:hypothetical protein
MKDASHKTLRAGLIWKSDIMKSKYNTALFGQDFLAAMPLAGAFVMFSSLRETANWPGPPLNAFFYAGFTNAFPEQGKILLAGGPLAFRR